MIRGGVDRRTFGNLSFAILVRRILVARKINPHAMSCERSFAKPNPLLNHPIRWFEEETRQKIACAFAEVVKLFGYTVFACAILRNHAHLVVRTHKSDNSETMWDHFTQSAAEVLRGSSAFGDDHPVWSKRPYKVFLKSSTEIRTRIGYVERNPAAGRTRSPTLGFCDLLHVSHLLHARWIFA